ncbi:hypothetical protein AAH211_23630 [Serratia fonticola]|uniref:hypothetical protein n=1 Tax=Serratia fonticola TaxID=47917 RepID=UPI003987EF81
MIKQLDHYFNQDEQGQSAGAYEDSLHFQPNWIGPLSLWERYRLVGYPASGISALNTFPDFTTP